MTFSFSVKNELCMNFPQNYEKALSEIIGLMRVMGTFVISEGNNITFKISSENKNIIKYVENILSTYFSVKFVLDINKNEYFSKTNNYILKINGKDIGVFLETLGIFSFRNNSVDIIDEFKENIIDRNFIKGVFLGCGSMSNPESGYHLEFIMQNVEFGMYFMELLNKYNLNSKIIKRKFYHVVYIKDAENISKFLNITGAHNALLEFENIRVSKEYSNNKNRIKNCIEANEDKLIITSVRQVRAIMVIEEKMGLKNLPKNLREIAEIRLKYKEMPLKELGAFLKPPIGKSGVSHRLRKIEKIAKELEDNS